jgi:hypothetical protein
VSKLKTWLLAAVIVVVLFAGAIWGGLYFLSSNEKPLSKNYDCQLNIKNNAAYISLKNVDDPIQRQIGVYIQGYYNGSSGPEWLNCPCNITIDGVSKDSVVFTLPIGETKELILQSTSRTDRGYDKYRIMVGENILGNDWNIIWTKTIDPRQILP